MRTISATLLAAATSLQGRPSVRATVEDRAIRWGALHALSPHCGGAPLDLPCVGAYSNGGLILRAAVDAAGHLYTQRVLTPSQAAHWAAWTLLAASASRPAGDVALTWHALKWWLYYQRSDRWLMAYWSGDDGLTWNGPAAIYRPGRTAALACIGPYLLVLESNLRAFHLDPATPSWSGPYTLSDFSPDSDKGVAAAVQVSGGAPYVQVLLASGGGIRSVRYDPTTQTYGPLLAITPGRDQPLALSADCRWPALQAMEAQRLICSWVENWSGDLAGWRHPVCRESADGEHWGLERSLADAADPSGGLIDRRLALCYDSLSERLYASNGERVLCAEMWDPLLNPLSQLGPVEALAYQGAWGAHDDAGAPGAPAPGRLRLTLLDADGGLSDPGAAGTAGQALRPLSRVIVSRGYLTAAGREEAALPPHYLLRARRAVGRGGGRVEIEAVDALGLLALWTPAEPLEWRDRVLRWLAAEVCAQVGLPYDDDNRPEMNQLLPRFTWGPGQTALSALSALLRLAGYVARNDAEGGVYALQLANHRPAVIPALGAAGEVLRGAYGPGWPAATAARVVGDDRWADGDDVALGGWLGLRRQAYLEDRRIISDEMAAGARDRALLLGALTARADEAVLPLRPDLELWDVVDAAGLGQRILTALSERWDAARGVYETEVRMGRWG